ncbi:hypothetical protein BT96DRAFT_706096 [Gymnopus androsaceus JB14]|uniref:Uncharacterized protein n=1 Tax=Gymnopus androsaceus JB14 TaxID=1447944 RepID=A0A6A4GEC1_9AGAR|nr:hypothetical protein BT96DRAFT_706096 [Gymnopus androsaceus JB14]
MAEHRDNRFSSTSTSVPNLSNLREASTSRLLDIWSSLAERYPLKEDQDDIIDIRSGELVEDRGVVRYLNGAAGTWEFGRFADIEVDMEEEPGEEEEILQSDNELDASPPNRAIRMFDPQNDEQDAADLKAFLEDENRRREAQGYVDESLSEDLPLTDTEASVSSFPSSSSLLSKIPRLDFKKFLRLRWNGQSQTQSLTKLRQDVVDGKGKAPAIIETADSDDACQRSLALTRSSSAQADGEKRTWDSVVLSSLEEEWESVSAVNQSKSKPFGFPMRKGQDDLSDGPPSPPKNKGGRPKKLSTLKGVASRRYSGNLETVRRNRRAALVRNRI